MTSMRSAAPSTASAPRRGVAQPAARRRPLHVRVDGRAHDEGPRTGPLRQRRRRRRGRNQRRAPRNARDRRDHDRGRRRLDRVPAWARRPRPVRCAAGRLRAHGGLEGAIASSLPGASWQRCLTHVMRKLLTRVLEFAHGIDAPLVRTIFQQPDTDAAWAHHARIVDQLVGRFADTADLLAETALDILAFTAFRKAHGCQLRSNNPLSAARQGDPSAHRRGRGLPNRAAVIRLVGAVSPNSTTRCEPPAASYPKDRSPQHVPPPPPPRYGGPARSTRCRLTPVGRRGWRTPHTPP
jgi:hypothetical protein